MPKFRFKAKDIDNKIIKGTFFATDENDLRDIVDNLGYFLISSRKIAESSQLFAFLEKIKVDEIALFCRQLAVMINSGLEITNAIAILKESTKNSKLKGILESTHHNLLQGVSFSDCFKKYPKTFPPFFINMIKIGELSGRMGIVLTRLADYYEKDDKTKRKVKSAFAYPLFLIAMSIVVVLVMALYVMPIFKDVFESLDAELPLITMVVLLLTDLLKTFFFPILIGILVIGVIIFLLLRTKRVKLLVDKYKLLIKPFKDVFQTLITARFSNGFSILISSSVPIVDAMETMRHLLDNKHVEKQMEVAVKEVERGQGIAKSIETINVFPSMLCEMITIGEETGNLEVVLNRVTDYYENQVDYAIKKMTSVIEPIMIIFIGGIVVTCLLAIFLPMLQITGNIDPGV